MILAQADLGQVPAAFIKEICILAVVFIVVASFAAAALFAGLQYFLSKRTEKKGMRTEIHPQPLEITKAPKRFVFDFWDGRHSDVTRQLTRHEREIERLQTVDAEVQKEIAEKFNSVALSLGRIEGKLEKL